MSLPEELLLEAYRSLAASDAPTQAALRRAISTSYYAVFHLLVEAASEMVVAGPGREQLRGAVCRTLAHSRMAEACKAFSRGNHKLSRFLDTPANPALSEIGRAFLHLQEKRHRADYDTVVELTWDDAVDEFALALKTFTGWTSIKDTEDARVFLVALLLWKDLRD